jgi:hypothetical protein
MINFCHISPTPYLETFAHLNGAHIILAHLVEQDEQYRKFYRNLDDGKPKIMDNSAFEMFKLGEPMYPSEKLIDLGKKVKTDYIVMTDYPREHWSKTMDKAVEMVEPIKEAGFGTFYCPQSDFGDMEGLLISIEWALDNIDIDLIGLSILSCPIACGVNETKHSDGVRDDAYKMQRFLSRWRVFREMEKRKLLHKVDGAKFHCLGMVDGPREIELLEDYHWTIYSWDSSAAIWAGFNGIRFDDSPTGLRYGKFEKEVNFNVDDIPLSKINNAIYNCNYINNLLEERNEL